jgi:GDP-L-fucose synthase
MSKTALVTGGCGFVGRRYVTHLSSLGYDVVCVDDLSTGLSYYEWFEFIKNRLTNPKKVEWIYEDVREFFKTHESRYKNFDLVVHLAAIVGGRLNLEGNPIAVATDLAIDSDFFNYTKKAYNKYSIYYSSSAAYPIKLQTKDGFKILDETDIDLKNIANPDFTYGWSKLTGEYLATFLKDHKIVIYRPFSGYGEDQDLTYPFPSIMKRVLEMQDPIEVWGDGKQSRDFIHIDNCIDISMNLVDQHITGTFNLSTGIETSFEKLIERTIEQAKILKLVDKNYNPTINRLIDKPVGVYRRVGDDSKIQKVRTFSYTPLDDGIKMCLLRMDKESCQK